MRIVSGKLGGRTFDSPPGNRTHPMSEKVRGALFNVLGDITDLTVLDAFAGSGALAFESVSRSAKSVVLIDIDRGAVNIIRQNAQLLGITDIAKVIKANINSWSDNNPDTQFDVVFCDPPYDAVNQSLLRKIAAHTRKNGVIVFSLPPDNNFSLSPKGYKKISVKSYGDAQLIFYRKLTD